MSEPVALHLGGHRCRLKWHRGRRQADDPAFSLARIRQGLAAGAAVEIDINPLACGDWAVLHDATLDRETTGAGAVSAIPASALATLRLRDNDGRPTSLPVSTLSAVAEALAGAGAGAGGHLQLDLKVGGEALNEANLRGFARAVGPLAGHVVLSGGDPAAVLRLAERSGVDVGFDPCHAANNVALLRSGAFDAFCARAMAGLPDARIVYLHRGLVAHARRQGADLIAPFRARGQEVDVYTIPDARADNVAEVRALLDQRADQITTDDALALSAALAPQAEAPGP